MPNLIHFKFLRGIQAVDLSFSDDLVNGYTWQHMFEMHVLFLSKSFDYSSRCFYSLSLFFLGNFVQSNDNDVSEQYSIYLSHIVHLANVNQINFEPCVFARLWEFIPFILQ
jgi:hypothetical protein